MGKSSLLTFSFILKPEMRIIVRTLTARPKYLFAHLISMNHWTIESQNKVRKPALQGETRTRHRVDYWKRELTLRWVKRQRAEICERTSLSITWTIKAARRERKIFPKAGYLIIVWVVRILFALFEDDKKVKTKVKSLWSADISFTYCCLLGLLTCVSLW